MDLGPKPVGVLDDAMPRQAKAETPPLHDRARAWLLCKGRAPQAVCTDTRI
jgi:hypothetical protein